MMTTPLKMRLAPDGTLDLHVATGLPASEVEVLVILQPLAGPAATWPKGFLESTYGALAEQLLERAEQGEHGFFRLKRYPVLGYLARAHVRALHCVGRVDHFADLRGGLKERNHPLQVPLPQISDHLQLGPSLAELL